MSQGAHYNLQAVHKPQRTCSLQRLGDLSSPCDLFPVGVSLPVIMHIFCGLSDRSHAPQLIGNMVFWKANVGHSENKNNGGEGKGILASWKRHMAVISSTTVVLHCQLFWISHFRPCVSLHTPCHPMWSGGMWALH